MDAGALQRWSKIDELAYAGYEYEIVSLEVSPTREEKSVALFTPI